MNWIQRVKKITIVTIIALFMFNCTDKNEVKVPVKTNPLNKDSLEVIRRLTKRHWALYGQLYSQLELDSLSLKNKESYRMVIAYSWGYNSYGGSPSSITFHKTDDTCLAVIKDFDYNLKPNKLVKKVRFIPSGYFDTIAKMFNTNIFWSHNITTFKCNKISTDPDMVIFEAVKNGRHKLVSLYCKEEVPLLENWKYNFLHYSFYNSWFDKDWEWYKDNPLGHEHTPGPPSALEERKRRTKKH